MFAATAAAAAVKMTHGAFVQSVGWYDCIADVHVDAIHGNQQQATMQEERRSWQAPQMLASSQVK
jgi:hypothetical protein